MSDLLTPAEVAAQLRVKQETLEAWRGKGIGPAYVKLGIGKTSPVRYRQEDVEKFLQRKKQQE
ncbi:Helix-turn-helix domain containing protein [uncultured Caudovirales phage]|uniref:Helix-turn-helix domain containing protein n=1 Tax=uncultured Caudovirales phage TaxID=2100421 RepID=A0A6J5KKP7_9CAUD|nr:Helix-turn-helix domain containing protein [uncultured Caudovirales phage]